MGHAGRTEHSGADSLSGADSRAGDAGVRESLRIEFAIFRFVAPSLFAFHSPELNVSRETFAPEHADKTTQKKCFT